MRSVKAWVVWLSLSAVSWGLSVPVQAQSQQPPPSPQAADNSSAPAPIPLSSSAQPLPEARVPGRISGTVVDLTGAFIVGAHVSILREVPAPNREALSDDGGEFSFANILPGPFQLTIAAPGFATQS